MKQTIKRASKKAKQSQEAGAKRAVLQELFEDLNRDRAAVYRLNFVRGIFFGLGSVLGGTVIIAILIWVLTLLAGVIPGLSDLFEAISRLLESPPEA